MAYEVEVTDTFGGQANYCWVHRHKFVVPNENPDSRTPTKTLVRMAKALEGWTGVKCDTHDDGDTITVRPRDACVVMFIKWKDE